MVCAKRDRVVSRHRVAADARPRRPGHGCALPAEAVRTPASAREAGCVRGGRCCIKGPASGTDRRRPICGSRASRGSQASARGCPGDTRRRRAAARQRRVPLARGDWKRARRSPPSERSARAAARKRRAAATSSPGTGRAAGFSPDGEGVSSGILSCLPKPRRDLLQAIGRQWTAASGAPESTSQLMPRRRPRRAGDRRHDDRGSVGGHDRSCRIAAARGPRRGLRRGEPRHLDLPRQPPVTRPTNAEGCRSIRIKRVPHRISARPWRVSIGSSSLGGAGVRHDGQTLVVASASFVGEARTTRGRRRGAFNAARRSRQAGVDRRAADERPAFL